jgi:GntR family carbon starvation induced transcriptional regulator
MTLAEKAYQEICRHIVQGAFRPGEPLRMAALSERYGMAYSPLREALTRLQSERLVVSVAMRGFSVAPLSMEEMWDAMQTRAHIETEALRLSIRHGDDSWEASIVAAHHALKLQVERASRKDGTTLPMIELRHHAFHGALIAACRSKWLLDFAQKLYLETERYRYPTLRARRGAGGRDVVGEHEQLMAATLARDGKLACRLLRDHLERTAHELEGRMGQLGASAEAEASAKS